MPNWTQCSLEVSGDPIDLKPFIKQAGSVNANDSHDLPAVISCEAFIPMPKELEGTNSPGDNPNWHDWQKENWGVKWGLCHPLIRYEGDKYITYEFDTPWTYPDNWLDKVAKKYLNLRFDFGYILEGYEGCGRLIYEKGISV